jgi:predicted acyltransferase
MMRHGGTGGDVEQHRGRLVSLDAFRGVAIAGMILVNQEIGDEAYPAVRHATWNGWTLADLVFPFFLFAVGVAITLSITKRRSQGVGDLALFLQILKRSVLLIVIGLAMHGFPFTGEHLAGMRWPGTLQRIGICYGIAAVIYLKGSLRAQCAWLAGLLGAYWLLMQFVPVPGVGAGVYEPGRNFAAYVDSLFLSGHMWPWHPSWDPDGIMSMLPAVGTTLFGILAGRLLQQQISREEKTIWMFVSGYFLMLIGAVLDMWLPINKSIWTSSYAIFTAGFALVVFSTFYWIVDVRGHRRGTAFLSIYGVNAIVAFVGSGILKRGMEMIRWTTPDGSGTDLEQYIFSLCRGVFADARMANLVYSLAFAAAMYGVVWVLWKKNVIIRV